MILERRIHFRRGLSTLYLPFYDRLCEVLPPLWQPYMGFRTFEEQTRLYAQGRTTPGPVVTHAKAGESAHNYGCASDWMVFENGSPIWIHADDPRYQTYIGAVRELGLQAGADFGDYDHNELKLDCSWTQVLLAFKATNMMGAQQKIEESRSP